MGYVDDLRQTRDVIVDHLPGEFAVADIGVIFPVGDDGGDFLGQYLSVVLRGARF